MTIAEELAEKAIAGKALNSDEWAETAEAVEHAKEWASSALIDSRYRPLGRTSAIRSLTTRAFSDHLGHFLEQRLKELGGGRVDANTGRPRVFRVDAEEAATLKLCTVNN